MQTSRVISLLAASLLAALSLGACYSMHYIDIDKRPAADSSSHWNHFGLGGLLGDPEVRLYEHCPDGVARVEVWHSPANVIVSIIALGLYTPSTTDIWCASPDAPADAPAPLEPEAPPEPQGDLALRGPR